MYRLDGTDYVALAALVQACGGRFWRVSEETPNGPVRRFVAVLSAGSGAEYVFWAESTTVRCADREILLPLAPRLEDGQLYIPVLTLGAILPDLAPSLPSLVLAGVFGSGDTAVARFGVQGSGARDVTTRSAWHGEARSGLEYRLAVAAKCDSQTEVQLGLLPILAGNGLLQSVQLEPGSSTVLVFTFRRPANASAAADSTGIEVRFWPKPVRRVRRIVLDPGHGGEDPGAVGTAGTLEKSVVLDVAKRVKPKLEEAGYEVRLTRTDDELVTLSDRSKLANEWKADLFVSIHANAAPNRQACGLETYFLSESKSDWERAVAARENAALEFEATDSVVMSDELELILTDLAQNEFLYESSELAARIHEQTLPLARVANRGVRQANFYVLRNNYMPAVLVECGFLTNRSEEKLLGDARHRERLAEGIAKGIVEFVKAYERRVNGS